MNYCRKCGAPLAPGQKFCTKCGTPVLDDNQQSSQPQSGFQQNSQSQNDFQQNSQTQSGFQQNSQPQSGFQQNTQTQNDQQNQWQNTQQNQWQNSQPNQRPYAQAAPKKPVNVGLIVGIIAAVVAVIILIFGINFYRHTIILKDYVKVDYTGFEDYGTAEPSIDTDKLDEKIGKLYGLSNKDIEDYKSLSELGGDLKKAMTIDSFVESIDAEADSKTDGKLSNGDSVKVKISYSKAYAKKLGLHVFGSTYNAKANGLKQGTVINPFESLDVKLTGALPYLVVNMTVDENSDFYDDEFRISGDDVDELGNRFYLSDSGDEFTITFNGEDDLENGIIYAPKEKTYKVGDVDTYVSDPSQLNSDDRKQLEGHAKKYLKDNDYDLKNLQLVGCMTGMGKPGEVGYNSAMEIVYVVLSYDYYDDWNETTTTEYLYVQFPEVVKQSDGSLYYYSGEDDSNLYYSFISDDFSDIGRVKTAITLNGYRVIADSSLEN